MSTIRILLVDDHAVVREGIKRLLDGQPDISVVAEADDGRAAVDYVRELRPDVVMMDVSMPGMNGIDATRHLRTICPDAKIVVLTVHEDEGYMREFFIAGARGFLLKRASTDEFVRAIRAVAEGGVYVDPRIAGRLVTSLQGPRETRPAARLELSERETEVLRLIALGHANKEIAAQLNISIKTVETYKARSMEKLGMTSRVDIVRLATEQGWLRR